MLAEAPEPHPAEPAFEPDRTLSSAARRRPAIAIGHPMLARGGSEAVVMWLIEALKHDFDIAIVTTGGWDLAALNEFYGTQVARGEVEVRVAPMPWPFGNRSPAALRGAFYQRFAQRIAAEFDLRISAYNFTDWGLPAIHFIADFSWDSNIRERAGAPSPRRFHRDSAMRRAYMRLVSAIGSPSRRSPLLDDSLVANSQWTAKTLRENCGAMCAATIYPPVWGSYPNVPWDRKEDSFAMIGRIAPEKRIEEAIAILRQVRRSGHNIKLRLCGQIGRDSYGSSIARLCREHAEWIVAEGRVSGQRKASILAQCRYGIHARPEEPFGIAVAEMVKAGAIVFAPESGGQAEILQDSRLLYSSQSDAAAKIDRVLRDGLLRSSMRSALSARAALFGAAQFVSSARTFIAALLPSSCAIAEGEIERQ